MEVPVKHQTPQNILKYFEEFGALPKNNPWRNKKTWIKLDH
jgi:hypothetical protein